MADAVVITPPADLKVSQFFASRLLEWRKLRSAMQSLAEGESAMPATEIANRGEAWTSIEAVHDACRALEDEVHAAAPANALELAIKVEMLLSQGQINWDFHDGIKADATRIVEAMFPASA